MKRPSSGNGCLTINESRTMKKIYSFMVAAVALFAAASCNKELPQENLPAVGETVVYTASTDGADTKAVLDGTVSKWCGEELITLHDGTNAFTFYADAGDTPVSKVDFTYNKGEGQPEFTATEVMAVYPSGDYTANLDKKIVSNVVVPNNQTLEDNTYPATAAVAVAYSTTTELSFKNATTLLKFKVAGDDVTYGCIAAEGDISGTFGLAYNDGEPELNATEANQWVDFSKNNEFLSKEATYYIAVAPAALNKITMYLNGAEVKSKTFEEPYQLKRNVILDLGTITYTAPETASTVYLKPGVWSADGAWYVAYFFNSTGNVPVKMEDTDADGLFEATVPEGKYSKVIFCRLNPEATEFVWESVWNQTENLSVPTSEDEKLCYVINGWESAEWQTVPEQPEEVTPGDASEWALVGAFSGWIDQTFVTTSVSNVVVLEDVKMKAAEGFLVRKPDTEWADKYGAGNVNYIQANSYITTAQNGADMCLEADGTYDIYFNTTTKAIYVMTAGTDYTTAVEQTVSGKEPEVEEPEVTANMLYLKPNSNWKVDNARFAAYFFGNGDKWVSMTDSDGDGIYEVNIPEGYDYGSGNVIFCRMNPNTTANNWNNKWNQTADLAIPKDGTNLYTVKDGTWDKGGGTWSTK